MKIHLFYLKFKTIKDDEVNGVAIMELWIPNREALTGWHKVEKIVFASHDCTMLPENDFVRKTTEVYTKGVEKNKNNETKDKLKVILLAWGHFDSDKPV